MRNIEVYIVNAEGTFSKSRHYKNGKSAIARRNYLMAHIPASSSIIVRHKPTGKSFYAFGTR